MTDDKHHSRMRWERNAKNVAWGEVVGSAVALGSVFAARKAFPGQTERMVSRLAGLIEKHSGKTPEDAQQAAERIVDVVLMNLGGMASMLTQFGMRRAFRDGHHYSLPTDLAVLMAGRIAGTSTMSAGLCGTEKLAEKPLRASEEALAKGVHWLNRHALGEKGVEVTEDERRAAYVVISNVLQSIYAFPGNAAAQTFAERVADSVGKGQSPRR